MNYLIKRDRRYWNSVGWTPYFKNARRFQTHGEAEQVARQMSESGVACAIVLDRKRTTSYQDRKISDDC